MIHSFMMNKSTIKTKTLTIVAATLAAVALPQIFHALGVVSGQGSALGETFLPMHLSVLLAGLLAGPVVGVIAGTLSPLISFALTGMPVEVMLPFIMIELTGYGLAVGMLSKVKMPVFFKLLLAQIAGRTIRAVAVLIAVYGLGSQTPDVAMIWNSVITGLPGILLQWCLIPLLIFRIESAKKFNV